MKPLILLITLSFSLPIFAQCLEGNAPIHEATLYVIKGSSKLEHGHIGHLSEFYLKYIKDQPKFKLFLFSYTDNQDDPLYNARRAFTQVYPFFNYFIDQGVDTSAIVIRAMGQSAPLYDESTGRSIMNNRIQLSLCETR